MFLKPWHPKRDRLMEIKDRMGENKNQHARGGVANLTTKLIRLPPHLGDIGIGFGFGVGMTTSAGMLYCFPDANICLRLLPADPIARPAVAMCSRSSSAASLVLSSPALDEVLCTFG
ncbi:hypothetical protein WR25_04906 [Diploscapter pachys]|uniref:Uncharacterized protein n=1 Tax=Diploscapter pachys TaxID=2018661 RepID=A0A2A2JI56_9BILA|nr:hypothetical protein WR25_04906 [Diploscapter pachys]